MARQEKKPSSLFSILFVGIVLGLVVAGVLAWYLIPREDDFRPVRPAPRLQAPPASISTPPATPAQPDEQAGKPANDYTFYDILPGDQAPKPKPGTPPKEAWWLQVAALKKAEDADALRGQLTLLNLNVAIVKTDADPPLHRVRVGPFVSQAAAESAGETLTLNKFEARLLKEPVAQ